MKKKLCEKLASTQSFHIVIRQKMVYSMGLSSKDTKPKSRSISRNHSMFNPLDRFAKLQIVSDFIVLLSEAENNSGKRFVTFRTQT